MQAASSLQDDLERGQVIEYEYTPEDADPGETIEGRGTVCKSNRGGIRVLPEGKHVRRIHILKAGSVQSKHRDGGSTRLSRTVGHQPKVQPTGETAGIRYKQGTGWMHVEEDA